MTPQNHSQRAMIGEPYILVICAIVGFLLVIFVLFFFLIARKRKEKLGCGGIGAYTTVPMKDVVVSTPLYCEPQDGRGGLLLHHHPLPPSLMMRSDLSCGGQPQYPFTDSILQDPEYAVPDIVAYNTTSGQLIGNGKIHQYSGGSAGSNSGSGGRGGDMYPTTKEQMKRKYPHLDLEDESRYYASTDVIARSNLLSFEQGPPVVDSNSINGHSPKPLTNSLIASHTPPPPLPPQLQNSASPPSSLSSNSSRLLKNVTPSKKNNNSANNSTQNSSDFDGYENTQVHSQASTKSPSPENEILPPVPSIKEADIKTIDGDFGYSKFGDCELGCLQRGAEKRLVILKTLSEKREFRQFYDEFINEMEEKWRLSNRCIDTFAMMHGYVVKHEYLAMVIEYGDVDLKKFLKSAPPMQIR